MKKIKEVPTNNLIVIIVIWLVILGSVAFSPGVALIGLIPAYYLTKFILLGREE